MVYQIVLQKYNIILFAITNMTKDITFLAEGIKPAANCKNKGEINGL